MASLHLSLFSSAVNVATGPTASTVHLSTDITVTRTPLRAHLTQRVVVTAPVTHSMKMRSGNNIVDLFSATRTGSTIEYS